MPEYRRWRVPGGHYFFTVALANRQSDLLVQKIDLFRKAVARIKKDHPFTIDAAVILPEHLHMVWALPKGDSDFSTCWGLIKGEFSKAIPKSEKVSASRIKHEERGIWQRRFHEHILRDIDDYSTHVDYIHYNPVKHGLVKRPVDWTYSSIHRYIDQGTLPANWGCVRPPEDMELG